MYYSKMLIPTLREAPQDAEIVSHKLMMRAGLIRKLASGIYSYLPLGYKALRNVERIIREEMDKTGALELFMSALIPAEILKESGRWDVFGPEMFRLKNRENRDFCLGPTHEESFTLTARNEIKSVKNLPLTLYQIQTKFRDEIRPRFGIMRCREFIMKDAYSFDKDEEGLDISYKKMYQAYCNIFLRLGVDYTVVDADSGAMGGSGSQEFMVKSDIGEDEIAVCDSCGYGANVEKAKCIADTIDDGTVKQPIELIATPDVRTISDLCAFFNCDSKAFAKTLILTADSVPFAVVLRGDRELSEKKLQSYLKCTDLAMGDSQTVTEVTGAEVGFAGAVGLKCRVICDNEVKNMRNFITGANKTGYHYKNCNISDMNISEYADIRNICEGDVCPRCQKPIRLCRGVEVGHIFKLGTKYTVALGCNFTDEQGAERPMIMGCYGIGLGRTLASIIEQNHDDHGIIWPMECAPYKVMVLPTMSDDPEIFGMAVKLHDMLVEKGIETIIDDRNERPGVKFNDCDLLGIPIRITVGRKAKEGIVEFKQRRDKTVTEMTLQEAYEKILTLV